MDSMKGEMDNVNREKLGKKSKGNARKWKQGNMKNAFGGHISRLDKTKKRTVNLKIYQ